MPSSRSADIELSQDENGRAHWRASGDWTLPHYERLAERARQLRPGADPGEAAIDWRGLDEIDTAGATLLADLLGPERLASLAENDPALQTERRALLKSVGTALSGERTDAPPARRTSVADLLAALGEKVAAGVQALLGLLGFMGLVLQTAARLAPRPGRWRLTPLAAHLQQIALNAVPIVALLTFMVGAVVAFLGATVLAGFGASIYTVNLVAYSFMREFGVLLTAILMAGRTASAFTAQIGSMKANEEIDAIRAQGLDPIELLVIPRLLAMLIALPLLTFIGIAAGIAGGALVCAVSLGIPYSQFLALLRDIELAHFLVGLGKAPVFAFMISVIGCAEGFKVAGSAQSVGEHTTSSVVQSIFVVILLDAVAALFFMEMGW
ncbi:ABC transporter permease [Orrella sp. JC864]|uniref:MlaE family ABC transporter permease n=1 Tax=Orrella sp. JC864 TaxID=3120298 RepID=UPI00300A09DA